MASNTAEDAPASQLDGGTAQNIVDRVAAAPLERTASHEDIPTHVNPAVRFNSSVQEFAPESSHSHPEAIERPLNDHVHPESPGEYTAEEVKALARSLKSSLPLQERRLGIFSYEPYSLPVSRTVSNEDTSDASRQATRSSAHQSPQLTPRGVDMTPPLTPAGTTAGDSKRTEQSSERESRGRQRQPDTITPQESTQEGGAVHGALAHRPARDSIDTEKDVPGPSDHRDHRRGLFAVGPSGGSPTSTAAPSRESSPSRVPASQLYSRPLTPAGEANDPYAAARRAPHNKIEPRFVFSRDRRKHSSPGSSSTNLARASGDSKRSGFFSGHHDDGPSKHGSMSELKRFLRFGKDHNKDKIKRTASPAASVHSGTKTPPGSTGSTGTRSPGQIPFGDDHGMVSKYGKFGKVLGSGAGGAVRLMKRSDGVVFAAKEFRARHQYETEREYVKKLTAEYCIGSSLHHGNVIETLDIVQEKGKWYEVMEYAPYDLFAIVMTGKMSREEISCCFLQMLNGVTYLHSMGLAHRDLKLDNVVVSERGILKLIDFGSAHVFRYPFESGMVLASGIVGSDPYLAPEVYDSAKYDATAVDIWSLAIIFCCMTLRRFPWKQPRLTDNSYKLFAAEPSPGHDPAKLIMPVSKSTNDLSSIPARDIDFEEERRKATAAKSEKQDETKSESASKQPASTATDGSKSTNSTNTGEKKEQIRGPWRILRLLPRESRHVISRMLVIDPKKRAKMDEILADEWVANTVICRQEAPGVVINADDHTHILKPPAEYTGAPAK